MTKNLLSLLVLLLISTGVFSQSFTSIWNTNNISTGSSAINEVTIPTNPAYTSYNYSVDWGDSNTDTGVTGDITHSYATPGPYTISISGDFPAIYFNDTGDRLKIIEILNWGTIQWKTMENAFYGCENLNFDAIDSPDLSQITSLKQMFRGCTSFNGIVNNWDTSTITDISGIFYEAEIFNRPLANWTTNSVTDMSFSFYKAELFNEPLDSWNTGAVTTMSNMFKNAEKFNQNINNWNVSQVTDMSNLFYNARDFNQPMSNWDVSKVTTIAGMFYATDFNYPINNWVVDNVTDMSSTFGSCDFNLPLNNWNVSKVTTLASTFASNNNFNQDINMWDVSNVTDMSRTFRWTDAFNQPLNGWNVSKVTNMSEMFYTTDAFNQNINGWDVSKVTNMSNMFGGWTTSYITVFNQPLDQWDVSAVLNMDSMFANSSFNQSIEGWDVSSVTNMNEMFYNATAFNQPLNNWSTNSVTNLSRIFGKAPLFNQPLDNWDTSSVTNMSGMFASAGVFDQDLSTWDISSVTNMSTMLSNSALSQENYDATLIGWATQTFKDNVSLGATGVKYCDSRLVRQDLIDNHGWNITGDIVNCSNVFCTTITNPTAGDTNVPANSNIHWAAAPNATGYYIDLEVERAGVRSYVNINGSPADNYDVGNVQILTFTNEFLPGDIVFITITPYNAEGPAVGCEEFTFTTVPSWVNSLDAYKITIDTRLGSASGLDQYNFKIQRNTSFSYNFSIDWGDSEYNNNVTNDITHIYNTPGIYTIAIIGDFPAPYFSSGDDDEVISIDQWGTHVYQSMKKACSGCENMIYNATDVPNLSQVTDMSEAFAEASLFNGNIDNWDVSNVTNMSAMFERAELFNQPLNSWDVSNVTNMYRMFDGFVRYMDFNQPLNNWDVSKVTNMGLMFRRTEFFNQPLNNWNVSNVTDMRYMFNGTTSFDQNLNDWNVSNVTDMSYMFSLATAFDSPLDNWDVAKVTNMNSMFSRSTAFNQAINIWDVSSVTTMISMFESAENFNQPLNGWDVSSVTNMASMFKNSFLFNQPIANWNVSRVTSMHSMFNDAQVFNQPLQNWNVNSVVSMQSMFESAEAFNQPLDQWNVSAVADMTSMFESALLFNQPLNSWDVSSVTLMPLMFKGAAAFNDIIGNWNVGSVTNMKSMFEDASVFDQPIQNWNTGEVLTMEEMFSGATAFNQNIDSWDVSYVQTMESMFEDAVAYDQTMNSWNVASVTTMEDMFNGATTFNGIIEAWNVRDVTTMEEMFRDATTFNQSLNKWRLSGVSNMDYMFYGASAYNQPMDLWNLGNVTMRSAFYNATALNQNLAEWNVSGVTDMRDMLDNTALIRENYDNTLIAWSEQTLTSGITLGAEGLPYCDAQEERQAMIDNFGWTFSLDVRDCPIPDCTLLASPLNGDVDVPVNTNITWEPALFAQGYRLTVGTTAGGTDVVNNATITNETSYEFASDFNTGDVVYVTIIPFNDEGDSVGPCTEESFTISNNSATIPECTNLTQPTLPATDVLVTSDLSWNPISNADGYKLTVGTSTGANDILNAEDVGNKTTYEFATNLPEDSDIFVTITPYNDEGDANACTEEFFHTELIPVPPTCTSLTAPLNGANDVPIDTQLSWTPVANAAGYLVIVGTSSGGIEVVNNADVVGVTNYVIPGDLQESRLHYVTIVPYNDEGDATGCIEETFTTGDSTSPPSCTVLTTPADLATEVSPATNLTWAEVSSATGYMLNVGTTSGGTDIFTADVNNVTTYDLLADLPESTLIYVTVIPYNDNGNAIGPCTEVSFTTDGPPSCTTLMTPANGATNIAVDTSIEWSASSNTDGYKLTVTASSSTANNLTDFDVTSGTTHTFSNDFERGETVTITIVPYNSVGDATGPCTSESFTIIPPPVPACTTLTTPANSSVNIAVDTNLEWNASTGADGYKLTVLASSSTANNITDFDVTSGTTYNFTNDFEQGETVSVTIVPYNDQGSAVGCTSESFTIKPVPSCTTLSSPINTAVDIAVDTDITWNSIPEATGYKLTVTASSSTANNLTDFDVTSGITHSFTNDFEQGETVTVTISPYNEVGDAIGCSSESFTIKPVPSCTNLTLPIDGSIDVAVDTNIEWTPIAEANGYKLTVSASSSTANDLTDYSITSGTTYNFPNDFKHGEVVTITLVPFNEVGDALGCTSESFTITPPPCTSLITPVNGATDIPVNTAIEWNASTDAEGYKITVLASSSTANNITDFNVTSGTTYNFTNDFEQGETVSVTIVPYNDQGSAVGCTSESFTIKPVPSCTTLSSPINTAVDIAVDTDITWNSIPEATGYKLTVTASSSTANNLTDFDVTSGITHSFTNDFEQGETVTVTITPYNEVGDAIGCSSESFTIKPVPSCTNLTLPIDGSIDVAVDTNIEWTPIAEANGYKLTVSASSSTANNVTDLVLSTGNSYDFPSNFEQGETVTVTLVSYNEVGDAIGCSSESFTIKPVPLCTNLVSPTANAIDVAVDTNIEWTPIADATGYKLTVTGSNSTANNLTAFNITSGTSYDFTNDFEQSETVTVTVTPYNEVGDALGCSSESFTIKSVPLCTNLTSPANNDIVAEISELRWNEITDADGYKLTINTGSTTSNNQTDLIVTGTTHVFQNDFNQGEVVTVTITPYNEVGDALGCTSESFTIRPIPPCTKLSSPLNNATEVSIISDVSWNESLDADGYRISVGTSANGTDIVNNEDVASLTSYTFGNDLPSETLIFVTIVPYNTSGDALGCTSDSFETEVIIPECTSITSPFNGESEVALESTITWNEVEKTDGYRISIGTTSGGTDIVNNQDVGPLTSYMHNGEFPFGTEIYVNVTAYNSKGDAVTCDEQTFTTLIPEDDTKYGFSPDGDGINEYWHIENIDYYPKNMVTIYNRWGDAVFKIENYNNGSEVFRGNANLKTKMGAGQLPSGTYFFHIEIEGETILKKTKGYVVIKR
ncbi:BspA family leucine-rich repeat surface protein [Zobellia laminariae]|uniref:BspA family leucine-rich repeat surface protein n=1 Tax=Zobellia laminariae TaxID=248906 RepID=UPI004056E661